MRLGGERTKSSFSNAFFFILHQSQNNKPKKYVAYKNNIDYYKQLEHYNGYYDNTFMFLWFLGEFSVLSYYFSEKNNNTNVCILVLFPK